MAKLKDIEVSIVIPAYNEEEAIGGDLEVIKETMESSEWSYEIIVVDDGSTDKTAEIAEEKGARVISHKHNKGSGAARKTGIKASYGDIIVMTDADGTYPNRMIPELLGHFPDYDQVIGARREEMGTHKFMRSFAKFIIRKIAEFLTGAKIPDLNTGLRAFKKDIVMKHIHLIPNGFSCVSTISLIYLTNGYDVKYIPIDYYKRIGKSKFHPIKDTSRYLLTVLRIVTYFNPLKTFITMAGILFASGIIKSVYDLAVYGTMQESDIILLITAVIIAALGMLADLIVTQGRKE